MVWWRRQESEMTVEERQEAAASSEASEVRQDQPAALPQAETKARKERGSWLRRLRAYGSRPLAARKERFWTILVILGGVLRICQVMFWRGPMQNIWSDPGRHLDNARHFL